MAQEEGMSYFAVLLPMLNKDKSEKFRNDHLAFLKKMREDGHVYGNGKFSDGSGGLVIYLAPSYDDCEALVKQDPYIINEARRYEIHEWEAVWAK